MQVIGVAGTAKNSGKTTTTASLLGCWPDPASLALTSIGYDGEIRDNVTGLPKPRLAVSTGSLVVTAEECLRAGSARLSIICTTRESTPLGQLVVARVAKPGLVVLAGPNNRRALAWFLDMLARLGAKLVLVDGALGRLSPLVAAGGLVLATGATRNQDINALAAETEAIQGLLDIGQTAERQNPLFQWQSLLVPDHASQLAGAARGAATVRIGGVVEKDALELALASLARQHRPPLVVFADPVKLLLSGCPSAVRGILASYCQAGGTIGVERRLPLLAVTVNPFFPRYNRANGTYQPGWVDGKALREAMAAKLTVPVVDVVVQGGEALARSIGLNTGAGGG